MKTKHTEGILKVVTQNYEHNPKEVIIGLGIEQGKGYHEMLFNTILPDSDKEYIEQHEQIKADSERVVKCWNMHDELLDALIEADKQNDIPPKDWDEKTYKSCQKLKALIKKATE